MDKDEYFKDFKLLDYDFIVVNRRILVPLVWTCPFTQEVGTLKFGKSSPFVIGEELSYYNKSRPKVPMGIEETKSNDLRKWINTL